MTAFSLLRSVPSGILSSIPEPAFSPIRPMVLRARVLFPLLILFGFVSLVGAVEEKQSAKTYEGTLQTGVMAIGGETTGTILKTKSDGVYELQLKTDELRKLAESLNGKIVVVTGEYKPRPGVEIRERRIIEVETLKEGR